LDKTENNREYGTSNRRLTHLKLLAPRDEQFYRFPGRNLELGISIRSAQETVAGAGGERKSTVRMQRSQEVTT